MKKFSIIFASIVGGIYLLFLILPLVISPVINAYSNDIKQVIEESTGCKAKLGKIYFITTPKLTTGLKISSAEFSLPTGDKIFSADNLKIKLSLIPLLAGKVELDVISADNLQANIKVRQDGHLLVEEYIPQPDPDKPSEGMQPLPFGIKLSNHLPNITIKGYELNVIDMITSKKYTLNGKSIKVSDFILDKKIKIAADGKATLDNLDQLTFDISIINRLMPKLSLNDMIFNPEPQDTATAQNVNFDILGILKSLRKTELTADVKADIATEGTFESPIINGFANVEKLSMLVDGNKTPDSYAKIKANNNTIRLDIQLNAPNNESTTLIGKFKTGKNPKYNMQFASNSKINNFIRTINALAKSFNYNDFETLTATGKIDADFSLKSDMKKLTSNGYLKIPNANVSYGLYNIAIKNINADISFDNMLNIKNIALEILSQPLKIYGTVKHDATTDLHITADKLLLKGLIAAAGQVQILKDNIFNSGTLSMNATIKGKLEKIIPIVDLTINNVDVKNIPSDSRVTIPTAKFIINTEDKTYTGKLNAERLTIINPMASIVIPEALVKIGEKDIDIEKAYLMLNDSKIDVTGKISNYINEKMNINIGANGHLNATDIIRMIPSDMRSLVSGKGRLPLTAKILGNLSTQDIAVNITADPENYVSLLDVDVLRNHKTILNSDIRIVEDNAKITNTGIYIDNMSNIAAKLDGSVNKLSKGQYLNLRLSVPKNINMVIPGLKGSNMGFRGDIDIAGTAASPTLKGIVMIPVISVPDMDVEISNIVANLNGPVITANSTVQKFKCGGIVAENLATEFLLKNYSIVYLNNLLGDAYDGKVSGNISYGIADGKITLNMKGSEMNAVKAIEGLSGIKNALSGTLGFNIDVTTKGATDVELMKNLAGKLTFDVNNGKFFNVGRFDTLLYAENILGNAILKAAVTSVTNTPIIQNTAEYKAINGSMTFANSLAHINPITVAGQLMSYYVTGTYNLINATTNVIILGRVDEKVVAILGPLGDLTLENIAGFLPKFGDATAKVVSILTSDPSKEKVDNIPELTSGSTNYSNFRVNFNGGIESKSSVKSFKWLSNCKVSPVDYKQEIQNQKNEIINTINDTKQSIQDTKQQFKDAKDDLKNQIQDTKQQFNDAKQQLKDLKNLFKTPVTKETTTPED